MAVTLVKFENVKQFGFPETPNALFIRSQIRGPKTWVSLHKYTQFKSCTQYSLSCVPQIRKTMKKKHHLHLERSEMILLGLLRPYGRDETVARIVLSSSIDCFGLNRTQVIDSGLIIFLNEFRNRYHARSRFRSFPGDWFRRCGGLRGASAVRKPKWVFF